MYSPNSAMPSTREFNADLASRFACWLRVQQYTGTTNRHYLASVVSLCRFLNDILATQVTHLDVRDFLASIAQKGLKRATIWRAMSICFDEGSQDGRPGGHPRRKNGGQAYGE
jgi:hypothetical protein